MAADSGSHIRLYLKWSHQFQFAGFYAAKEKGFYRDEGLDVEFIEKRPGLSYEEALLHGEADYAIMDTSALLSPSAGKQIKIIAAIFQHSPLVLLTRKSSGIRTVHDLVGKRIMYSEKENTLIPAMLSKTGIGPGRYYHVEHSYQPVDLIHGRVDAMSAYITTQPYLLDQLGVDYYIIDPASYGLDFYGDMLITTDRELQMHEERAEAFRRASIRGWRYALDNSEEIVQLIIDKYNGELDPDHLRYQARKTRVSIAPDLVDIGRVNPERLKAIVDIYREVGMLPADFDTDSTYYQFNHDREWINEMLYGITTMFVLIVMLMLFLRSRQSLKQRKLEQTIAEANRLFTTAFNSSPLMMAITRLPNCEIIMANDAMCDILGYPREELIGKTTQQVALLDEETKQQGMRELQASGQAITKIEFRNRSGQKRYGNLSASILTYHDYEAALLIIEDTTDQVLAEKQNKRLQTQLQQTQKMESIGQLTGGIAHDFNNILASILGFAELSRTMYANQVPSKMNSYLDEIITAGRRARDIVEQMLTFSRGSREMERFMDPLPVIEDACKLMQASIPSTIELNTQLPDKAPNIRTTDSQLHQLLLNLVLNARAALKDEGKITIRLDTRSLKAANCDSCHTAFSGHFAVIEVCDDGPGIDPILLPRIFEPFFTTRDIGEGTGMGLPIVHGIMHGIDGHIMVDTSSEGTCVQLLFPLSEQQPPEGVEESAAEYIPIGEKPILVVDDERSITELMTELLSINDYRAEVYNDPLQALAAFTDNPSGYALILTDQTMPGINGTELAAKAKAIREDVPVILATGYSNLVNDANVDRFEIDRLLYKPIDSKQLLSTISELLSRE